MMPRVRFAYEYMRRVYMSSWFIALVLLSIILLIPAISISYYAGDTPVFGSSIAYTIMLVIMMVTVRDVYGTRLPPENPDMLLWHYTTGVLAFSLANVAWFYLSLSIFGKLLPLYGMPIPSSQTLLLIPLGYQLFGLRVSTVFQAYLQLPVCVAENFFLVLPEVLRRYGVFTTRTSSEWFSGVLFMTWHTYYVMWYGQGWLWVGTGVLYTVLRNLYMRYGSPTASFLIHYPSNMLYVIFSG